MTRGLEEADVLITTGGSSMGLTDLLKPVIEHKFGGNIHFGRVAMKPGKPTTFATVRFQNRVKLIFSLPGNPVSALVTNYIFVLPALRALSGRPWHDCQLPRLSVVLACDMHLDPRPEFHRVMLYRSGDEIMAYSTGGQRSSRVGSLHGANGLVHLPSRTEEVTVLKAGIKAEAVIIGEIFCGPLP